MMPSGGVTRRGQFMRYAKCHANRTDIGVVTLRSPSCSSLYFRVRGRLLIGVGAGGGGGGGGRVLVYFKVRLCRGCSVETGVRAEPRRREACEVSPADRTMDVDVPRRRVSRAPPPCPPRGPRRGVRERRGDQTYCWLAHFTLVVCFVFYAHSNTFNYETMLAQSACIWNCRMPQRVHGRARPSH